MSAPEGVPPTAEPPAIVDEAGDWIWLSKPPGLPVFPPHRDPGGPSLLRWLLEARPAQADHAWLEGFAGGIAHRLDVSTSGLVLAARTPQALAVAREAFRDRRLTKSYQLLSDGRVGWEDHIVRAPLAHHKRRRSRMVVQRGRSTPHRGQWYAAETRLFRRGEGRWEARMRTGVTHQIRVHAAFVGLPLLGDRLYGGRPLPEGVAPEGVDFALHHLGLEGLPGPPAPRLEPPGWWRGVATGAGR